MSRTYRLRRYKTKWCDHFGDAYYSHHNAAILDKIEFIIAHQILNLPCVLSPPAPIIVDHIKTAYYDYEMYDYHTHSRCIRGYVSSIRSPFWWATIERKLFPYGLASINSKYSHPYIRVSYRKNDVFNRKSSIKSKLEKRRKKELRLAIKTNNYDVL